MVHLRLWRRTSRTQRRANQNRKMQYSGLSHFARRLAARFETGGIGEAEFNALALELFAMQFAGVAPYRAYCEARGCVPGSVADWRGVPAVPAAAFKADWNLTSIPEDERTQVFHSSGTSGSGRGRHYHHGESLALYEAAAWRWFREHLLGGEPVAGILSLTPGPNEAPRSSLVHMVEAVRRCVASAASKSGYFGRVTEEGDWELDARALLDVLEEWEGDALLLTGTAFSWVHFLDFLRGRGRRLHLPLGSRLMETGGYKGRSRQLSRDELHARLASQLGIERSAVVTEYGMSELSSQAYDHCVMEGRGNINRFRFPPWVRARVLSPESGKEVAPGEVGWLRIHDLANVWSVAAIQTEDLARRGTAGFELIGRASGAEPRGCSLMQVAG